MQGWKKRKNDEVLSIIWLILGIIGIVAVTCFLWLSEGFQDRPVLQEEQTGQHSGTPAHGKNEPQSNGTDGDKGPCAPIIVLDAGHGGKDVGCIGGSVYEKDVNLSIVMRLKEELENRGFTVRLTRETDVYLTLQERVDIAEDCNADVFISVHQNALENDITPIGIETYCNVQSNSRSAELAGSVQGALIRATGTKNRGIITDSDLYVVHHTTMPACLIETGFLTTPEERRLLLDAQYQQKIAVAIAEGIKRFLGE